MHKITIFSMNPLILTMTNQSNRLSLASKYISCFFTGMNYRGNNLPTKIFNVCASLCCELDKKAILLSPKLKIANKGHPLERTSNHTKNRETFRHLNKHMVLKKKSVTVDCCFVQKMYFFKRILANCNDGTIL